VRNGLSNEEGGLKPLLLLRTINSFCHMYFYLQTSELLSGKAFNSMSDILHFDVRNVSFICWIGIPNLVLLSGLIEKICSNLIK
jgi:hypothetical protein